MIWPIYFSLVGVCTVQRLFELNYSRRNQRQLREQGFVQRESGHEYGQMVMLHSFWFAGLLMEATLAPVPVGLEWQMVGVIGFLLTQVLRLWVLATLGVHWNTSIMSPEQNSSGMQFVASGPYRFIRHPNYLAVILEFLFLPLAGGALRTMFLFSFLNGLILIRRIRNEEIFLFARPGYREKMGQKARVLPGLF